MNHKLDHNWMQSCANHLMLNSNFISNLGLYHGKMGIVLFFSQYANYTRNVLYDDFAEYLLDQICDEIHDKLPYDIEDGLCGIGWGIEYLFQKKIMQGDPNHILADIDAKIMELNPQKMQDKSLRNGLEGIIYYVTCRLIGAYQRKDIQPFDSVYLYALYTTSKQIILKENHQTKIVLAAKKYIDCMEDKYDQIDFDAFLNTLFDSKLQCEDIDTLPLGIEKGCAGVGLNIILS